MPLTLSAPRHSKSPEESRVFGIPHPSFLCRVKRALPFLLPQHRRATIEMARDYSTNSTGYGKGIFCPFFRGVKLVGAEVLIDRKGVELWTSLQAESQEEGAWLISSL